MDDFIGIICSNHINALCHASRAMLYAIHFIFPSLHISGHASEDPILQKKLLVKDGIWAVQKEILGWVFDGITLTLELPQGKLAAILTDIHRLLQSQHTTQKAF